MDDMGNFPFGQKVKKVEQKDKTQKKVFVLGVYASAVHAKWVSEENKILIRALAVASEPYIFWRGENAENELAKIKLPIGAGKLYPAEGKFNGPSGKALDECFLEPLKLNRDDCWLCDLVPYSMINPKQKEAIKRNDNHFSKYGLKRETMKESNSGNRRIGENRIKEILSEIKQSNAKYLITLGNEPLEYFLSPLLNKKLNLNKMKTYGEIIKIEIGDNKINWLLLTHPRQAAKLGNFSKDWYNKHKLWQESADTALIIL